VWFCVRVSADSLGVAITIESLQPPALALRPRVRQADCREQVEAQLAGRAAH
jgi:hypothetical protein